MVPLQSVLEVSTPKYIGGSVLEEILFFSCSAVLAINCYILAVRNSILTPKCSSTGSPATKNDVWLKNQEISKIMNWVFFSFDLQGSESLGYSQVTCQPFL